jgi:hypothetical protein
LAPASLHRSLVYERYKRDRKRRAVTASSLFRPCRPGRALLICRECYVKGRMVNHDGTEPTRPVCSEPRDASGTAGTAIAADET